jgi:hypothetical protein
MKPFLHFFACLIILGFLSSCSEEGPHKNNVLKFTSAMNNRNGNAASGSTAQGRGIFEYNKTTQELKYNINYQNVMPTAVTINSGQGTDHVVFTLTINPAGNQALGTVPQLSPENQNALLNELMYVNITSKAYPSGEIRGQIFMDAQKY